MTDRTAEIAPSRVRWVPAALLATVVGALLCIRLDVPGFFDNEGRYAEVARAMVATGDWITPRMDGTLFLNKPPLTYWLTATAFELLGRTEWARVVSVLAGVLTLFATARLGAALYGECIGLLAGLILATMLDFTIESRTLRPDSWIAASVVIALLCWHHAEQGAARRRTAWLVGFWAALGVGVLAKGFVPVILVAPVLGVPLLRAHGIAGVRRLRPLLGLAVFGAVVLPWHVLVALRHPGFAWDYVVNQHLLFFLDKKLPRDSEGDPLWFFWMAFGFRCLPWICLAPFAGRGTALPWTWVATVMGLFSLAPSRLEHYSVPAMPAVALLAACGVQRLRQGLAGVAPWRVGIGLGIALAGGGIACVVLGEGLVAGAYWIGQAPAMARLVRPAGALLLVWGAMLVATAAARRATGFLCALAAGTVALTLVVERARVLAEPLFSWRPLAEAARARLPADTEVVFESPEEYQLVGGLSFYLDRPVTLLEFPGFVPPTYLERHFREMFLPRTTFSERWQSGEPLAFVSDPQRRRDTPEGLVPAPYHVVARFGDRWLLANFPPASVD